MTIRPQYIITALLALAFGASGYLLALKVMAPVDVDRPQQTQRPAKQNDRKRLPLKAYEIISKSPLMGSATKAKRNANALPKSKINATLVGTIHADDPEKARAIVQIRKGQELMRLGDTIGNAAIVEIGKRSIVLSTNGREEVLAMPE